MTYRPWMGRTVGIEMEMNRTTTTGAALTEAALVRVCDVTGRRSQRGAGYYHSDGRTWDVKLDGSCGWEVASPALVLDENGDNVELRAVCDGLTALRPQVDRSCGLHVHVDCSDYDWRDLQKLMSLWARYEPYFFSLCPPSRRRNTYCQPLRRTEWAGRDSDIWPTVASAIEATTQAAFERNAMVLGRYTSLNVSGFWRHGRVEFRLHSGTVNYTKIRNWTKMLLALVARVKHPTAPRINKLGRTEQVMFTGRRAVNGPTAYISRVLGLGASRTVASDVPAENRQLVAWMEARRRQFDPSATVTARAARRAGGTATLTDHTPAAEA